MKLVLLLFGLITVYCITCPYTKVEESFNLQAIHDVIHYGLDTDRFDHLEFPGVVPRTFFGATIVAIATRFLTDTARTLLKHPPWLDDPLSEQIIARVLLGAAVSGSFSVFQSAVRKLLGPRAAVAFLVLLCCQFHLPFWSSRTLPNIFALPLTILGLASWLESLAGTSNRLQKLRWMIRFLTFAGIVFRFEVGILLVVIASLEWIVYGTLPLSVILVEGFITAVASLALTVPLDSYFWQRWLWPEGEVFYFNAILNKSSEWGTSPWYTYFVLFLPKLLFISYPLAWIGFVSHPRVRRIMVPGLIYIGLFSFLPHKEWRFIIYTIPLFTAAAASTVAQVSIQCRRSLIRRLAFLLMLAGMTISLAASLLMFTISQANYPGGHALRDLHMSEHPLRPISVHLDVPTAMTGASRFGQKNRRWQYHKTESHAHPDDYLESEYTHLITADPSFHDSAFKTVHVTYGYSGLRIKSINAYLEGITKNPTSWHSWVPIQVRITPKLYTMKLVDPQTTWVDFTLRKHPMVVYSKTYCPYCNAAKQLLNRYCPDAYFVIEVDKRPDGLQIKQALIQRSGRHTFPQVYVQGKILGGYDDLLTLETQKGLADRLVCDDDKLAKHSNIGG